MMVVLNHYADKVFCNIRGEMMVSPAIFPKEWRAYGYDKFFCKSHNIFRQSPKVFIKYKRSIRVFYKYHHRLCYSGFAFFKIGKNKILIWLAQRSDKIQISPWPDPEFKAQWLFVLFSWYNRDVHHQSDHSICNTSKSNSRKNNKRTTKAFSGMPHKQNLSPNSAFSIVLFLSLVKPIFCVGFNTYTLLFLLAKGIVFWLPQFLPL